jgi:hypothetical protein
MSLPLYKLTINEDENAPQEVTAVALVDMPAIGENFFAFKDQKQQFAVVNEDERILVGAAMIPDMPIFRKDPDGTEYNVVFDKQTIQKIALKFFEKGYQKNANEMHNSEKPVDVTIFQSWIADESKGIPKMEQFKDLPDGTWFIGMKINDEAQWQKVKDGTFKGFSVEGLFKMTPLKMRAEPEVMLSNIKQMLQNVLDAG